MRQSPSAHREVPAGQAPVVAGFSASHDAVVATHVPSAQRFGVPARQRGMLGQLATLATHWPSLQSAAPAPHTQASAVATHVVVVPSPLAHLTGRAAGQSPVADGLGPAGGVALVSGWKVVSPRTTVVVVVVVVVTFPTVVVVVVGTVVLFNTVEPTQPSTVGWHEPSRQRTGAVSEQLSSSGQLVQSLGDRAQSPDGQRVGVSAGQRNSRLQRARMRQPGRAFRGWENNNNNNNNNNDDDR